jgi:hypothetical protein
MHNRNQHDSIDFDGMSEELNRQCLPESLKSFSERRKIFPKTPYHRKAFHTRLIRGRNERSTLGHPTLVIRVDGVIATAIASRAVAETRRIIQHHNTMVQLIKVEDSAPLPTRPYQQIVQPSAVVYVPPVEVDGVATQPELMGALMRQSAASSKLQRCCRCGNKRYGMEHKGWVPINSPIYCAVTIGHRVPHWIVPAGYTVGDTRKKPEKRAIIRVWKREKARLNIPMQEPAFPSW